MAKYITSGRWELRGDFLYRYNDSGREYTLEKSQITYTEEMKDSLESNLEHTEASMARRQKSACNQPGRTSVRFVSIDASSTKLEIKKQKGEEG